MSYFKVGHVFHSGTVDPCAKNPVFHVWDLTLEQDTEAFSKRKGSSKHMCVKSVPAHPPALEAVE